MTHYLETKELPATIRSVLRAHGFNRDSIAVEVREKFSGSGASFEGNRSFLAMVNIMTGEQKSFKGSWGGFNLFENKAADAPVDHEIPAGFVGIRGENGGRGCFATLYVNPQNAAGMLPGDVDLTGREKAILGIFKGLKSSARKECLAAGKVTKDEIQKLADGGFLKIARNGATKITTAGRNAAKDNFFPSAYSIMREGLK